MTGKIPPSAAALLNDMRHQAQVVFHKDISGLQIPLGAALQVLLFLRRLQGAWEGASAAGQAEGEKQAVHHQVDHW